MRIVQLTPGSGDTFYCENCLRDRAIVRALRRRGHDALMVPLYLPPNGAGAGEEGLSPIFYGGINVYLQQKWPLFRRTPRWIDRLFDLRPLLRLAGRLAGMTSPDDLAATTLSMLRGEDGRQRKELRRLTDWLRAHGRPDVVVLSNVLLVGLARAIRAELHCPVVCLLQDEDEFLDGLPETPRRSAWSLLADRAADVDRFVAVSEYFRTAMASHLRIDPGRIDVVHVGVDVEAEGDRPAPPVPTIGYLSRTCPPKGLDVLVEAAGRLRGEAGLGALRLRIAGGSTGADAAYLRGVRARIDALGLADRVEFVGHVDAPAAREFLRGLSVLAVPVRRGEASGRYVLEAWAQGVPVVQPASGVFPELLAGAEGGLLHRPEDPADLAEKLRTVLRNPAAASALGAAGRRLVAQRYTVEHMAEKLLGVYQSVTESAHPAGTLLP